MQNREDNNQDKQVFLAAYDPLMKKYQAAQFKQLTKEHDALQIQLIQTQAKCKSLRRTKEDIGVRLYGVQQQLAQNQSEYQRAHQNYNQVQKARLDSQQQLKHINQTYYAKKSQVQDLNRKRQKAQKELQTTIRNVREVTKYNQNSKNQIQITRTVSHTAQENVVLLQKQKKIQDQHIDQMTQEIKRLIQQSNIITAQLVSQKAETEQAKKILQQAQKEMQKIMASKKNLLERWQKSLTVMAKMDLTLQSIRSHLDNQKQVNLQLRAQISGITSQYNKQQGVSQQILMRKNQLRDQQAKLTAQGARILQQRKSVSMQLDILNKSSASTQAQIKLADKQRQSIEQNMNMIEQNIMKLHTQTKKLSQQLINKKSLHMTIEKTANNLQKQAYQVANQIQDAQIVISDLQNQIARVKIDQLNTKAQIQALEIKKSEVIQERKKREVLVATYEINIRQSHQLNEKKQHQVGQLNKANDKLTSMQNDQNNGLHETKLLNIQKQTAEIKDKNTQLFRDWMKKQTQLVHKSNQLDQVGQNLLSLQTRKTILQQKKIRLNQTYSQNERQITQIQISLKNFQKEMNKQNDGLAVYGDKHRVLQNQIFSVQSQFVQRLRDFQKESLRIQVSIDNLREQKAVLLSQIVQAEKHIELWQRKYTLEKQAKEELDPHVGQNQLNKLKKEYTRIVLQYSQIKKKQQAKSAEIQRQTLKRDTINLKYTKPEQPRKKFKVQPSTSAQMESAIKGLKHQIQKTVTNKKQVQKVLKSKQGEHDEINQRIQQAIDRFNTQQAEVNLLNNRLANKKIQKLINVYQITQKQNHYRKIQEMKYSKARLTMSQGLLNNKYEETISKNQELLTFVRGIMEKSPQYQDIMKPILALQK